MGYGSGGQVFDPVAHAMIKAGCTDEQLAAVLGTLAEVLCSQDWDTVDESFEEFAGHLTVRLALRRAQGSVELGWDPYGDLEIDRESNEWVLGCAEHDELARGDARSAVAHDELVRLWFTHHRDHHHGDGEVDEGLLIGPARG